ncbi:hypothetical protein CC78DRAFT_541359 [Lojkania enalia]|uniref:Uncharacterized protein n=1 Tax=Lojkania enalia TaxID=147567 RepID=A0A9P4KEH4_9PLEO|nr:hypothetical protein CC78DRAFT_541359 [Didymosphaeria enalia]
MSSTVSQNNAFAMLAQPYANLTYEINHGKLMSPRIDPKPLSKSVIKRQKKARISQAVAGENARSDSISVFSNLKADNEIPTICDTNLSKARTTTTSEASLPKIIRLTNVDETVKKSRSPSPQASLGARTASLVESPSLQVTAPMATISIAPLSYSVAIMSDSVPETSTRERTISESSSISKDSHKSSKERKGKVVTDQEEWPTIAPPGQGTPNGTSYGSISSSHSRGSSSSLNKYTILSDSPGIYPSSLASVLNHVTPKKDQGKKDGVETPAKPPNCQSKQASTSPLYPSYASVASSPPRITSPLVPKKQPAMKRESDFQIIPRCADFPITLPVSTPRTVLSGSAVSYANVAHSPATSVQVTPAPTSIVQQDLENITNLTAPHRCDLLNGPQATIYAGNTVICKVSKRAAMAVSSVLNNYFTKKPRSLEFHIRKPAIDPDAVVYLLDTWMKDVSQLFEVPLMPFRDTVRENVALIEASRFLGMSHYTEHIQSWHINYLKTNIPDYEEVLVIEELAALNNSRLYTAMVNTLAIQRFRRNIPDPEEFSAFLSHHPKLKASIEAFDARYGTHHKNDPRKFAARGSRFYHRAARMKEQEKQAQHVHDDAKIESQHITVTEVQSTTIHLQA